MGKPADYALILNSVMWLQVGIATIFIALRVYTRYFIIRCLGWDDLIMVVNLVTFIGFIATTSIGITYGVGRKTEDITRLGLDNSKAIMWEAIGQGICVVGIAASKASVALFLLRIVMKKWHIALLWGCIVTTTIFSTITTILLFVQCKPTAFLWDHQIPGGVCWLNFSDVALTMGAWSATMDFVLAILPWHVVMGLNMRRKEKITIACGLSLGVFAGACSVVRTIELKSLASMENYVYDTAPMLLWSSSEICLTVICACIPVLRPLYVRIAYGSRGDSSNGTSYPLDEYSHSKKGSSVEKKNSAGSRIYMGPGASVLQTTVNMADDNASEETILRECHKYSTPSSMGDMESGIKRTHDIHVETTAVDQV